MQGRNGLKVFAVVAGMLLSAAVTRADLLSGCGSCFGSTYLLQYNPTPISTSGSENIYDVFLTIDATGYNGSGSFINAVDVKIASSTVAGDSSLVSAPGGAGVWSFIDAGLNANGCKLSGGGFVCAQDSNHAPVPGGTYTWEFHYATTDALLTGNLAASIQTLYTKDAAGTQQAGITSEGITLQNGGGGPQGSTPEPTSILLFGSLVGFTGLALRKIRKAS